MKNLNFRKLAMALAGLIMAVSLVATPMVKPETHEGGAKLWFQSLLGANVAHAQTSDSQDSSSAGRAIYLPVIRASAAPAPAVTSGFYVSPSGSSSNDGSIAHPWDLQTALNQPSAVNPGTTIYLRAGSYKGAFVSNLNGSAGHNIIVRAYPGERATLINNGSPALDLAKTSYVTFMGLEITGSYSSRVSTPSAYGVRVNQGINSHHINLVNMVIHDVEAQGMAWWQALTDSEIYGCLFYENGTTKLDHGVYAHNVSGTKYFTNNFVFDNASHGFHGYAETADKGLNNFVLEGNTLFNNGSIGGTYKRNILMGGLTPANNDTIINNYTYYPGSSGDSLNLGYSAGSNGAVVKNNYFMGGTFTLGGSNSNVTMTGNTVYAPGGMSGFSTGSYSSNTWLSSKPSGTVSFVRPNKYETNRANITIYNWSGGATVNIPASQLGGIDIAAGRQYELHNVQDFYGDVVTGVYNGSAISVPMTNHSVAQPMGLSGKPASTFPTFGAFVLIVK